MKKILLTGSTGIMGPRMARRFLDQGYEVTTTALVAWPDAPAAHIIADLRDFGQAVEVLRGVEGVVHLAAINKPGVHTDAVTFNDNMASAFNLFRAASIVGVGRVVWASSCHTAGAWWSAEHYPRSLPITEDEQYQLPDAYGLAKYATEKIIDHARYWGKTSIAALRFGYVHEAQDYGDMEAIWKHEHYRAENLWNYIDGADAFEITGLALEADAAAGQVFNAVADDTIMNVPSRDLAAARYPHATLPDDLPIFGTLVSNAKARKLLGFRPRHSWRDHHGNRGRYG